MKGAAGWRRSARDLSALHNSGIFCPQPHCLPGVIVLSSSTTFHYIHSQSVGHNERDIYSHSSHIHFIEMVQQFWFSDISKQVGNNPFY